ncbi:acyl-CoA dehydrogenase family protein [Nocardioides sp. TF02-7]|uniref:acyl-CoA dehydrogenase family protein n=1 Tax=Nocardioides sp. TF02-7 TaxID=2917724 RepID=UPI001F060D80|nr:acyl-CoA dehydrogenase family protein [Nocardioides sp. TF02-7]UMG92729.1 acyl-CoA dehydrogenase family protein [Nocardioides sp. TF02-7]
MAEAMEIGLGAFLRRADELADLVERTRSFVRDVVLPIEDAAEGDVEAAGGDRLRVELQQEARARGLLSPHGPEDLGGLGLGMVDRVPVFEAAGWSLFGPMALNIAAPDEGNMHLLDRTATGAQREEFLRPLVGGQVRSAFAMTEPAPGAGSDPSALRTEARRVLGGWRISGRKIFITGADGAGFFIVMARTSGQPGDSSGATMFLTPADVDGIRIVRHVRTLDRSMLGGHCEVVLDDVFVPDDGVLGEVDQGFANAQVRLGPARMTHVMRWLGAALRGHDVALRYVTERQAFGGPLAESGLVHQMVADNEIDIAATRALLLDACRELDSGGRASASTSIAKTFGAEAIGRIVDRSVQMCGGLGVSEDLPLARLSREVRPFRIYDGASEVHRWSIARRALRKVERG